MAVPVRPALAVRPTLCIYELKCLGESEIKLKFIIYNIYFETKSYLYHIIEHNPHWQDPYPWPSRLNRPKCLIHLFQIYSVLSPVHLCLFLIPSYPSKYLNWHHRNDSKTDLASLYPCSFKF